MSEQIYPLLSWNGQAQGSFTATEIKSMWEKEEISGLFQVTTDQGNLSVQEFVSFIDEQNEKEQIHQQQLALAQAEAENLKIQQQQVEFEANHKLELEKIKIEQENAEKANMEAEAGGKIYYIYLDGEKKGPYSKKNMKVMYRAGKVDDSTMVWTKDLNEWVELIGFQEITDGKKGIPMKPIKSGFKSNTAQFKYDRKIRGAVDISNVEFGGFWLRFAASFIDSIITYILGGIIGFCIGFFMVMEGSREDEIILFSTFVGALLNWFYYCLFECSEKRATWGKMACGLTVVDLAGDRISFGRACGRYFSKIISGFIFFIGFLMCAFTDRKQCLHDMIAGCLVIKKS